MHARNMEFIRDRSSLGWNILFPLLLVLAFAVVFSGDEKPLYKVGVLGEPARLSARDSGFFSTRYIQFIPVTDLDKAIDKVEHFQLDMLIDVGKGRRYWVNGTSPGGYLLERILGGESGKGFQRVEVQGRKIRYVDWVVPGVLAMNMMFSCLFGVGYVIVRYRKNGFLKRLRATPLKPFEFLLAQMTSRLILIQVITVAVYIGCDHFIHFEMRGSYANLFLISLAGSGLSDLARPAGLRTAVERGACRRHPEPAHLAHDAALGRVVLPGRHEPRCPEDRPVPSAHTHRGRRAGDHDRGSRTRRDRSAPRRAVAHERGLSCRRLDYLPVGIEGRMTADTETRGQGDDGTEQERLLAEDRIGPSQDRRYFLFLLYSTLTS